MPARRINAALTLLALCGLLLSLATAANAQAPPAPALGLGELQIEIESGYGSYAFPIANAALARRWTSPRLEDLEQGWARSSQLGYQVAYDYSVIPVSVHILHRRPEAFRGRIEVLSAHGYHNSEATSGNFVTVSQEFNAPPSVPVEFTLAPRVSPPSRPGQVTRLQVRLYQQGIAAPIEVLDQEVVQLEPAHVYSLLLDAPDGTVLAQELNRDNHLQLALPDTDVKLDPALLQSRHYLFASQRQSLTGMPLAARQFVFAVADLRQVRTWPAAEQEALLAYVIGGGRLMLHSADSAPWQGLSLRDAQPLGRGWLLCDAGGVQPAAQRIQAWLEGELEEFVLFTGGTARGRGLNQQLFNEFRDNAIRLERVFAVPETEPGARVPALSQRAGYLHPLHILREAADRGALEPWDYPEFAHYPGDLLGDNANLRAAAANLRPGDVPPPTLAQLCAGERRVPSGWVALAAAGCFLLGLLGTAWQRLSFTLRPLLAVGGALLLTGLAVALPMSDAPARAARLRLTDTAAGLDCAVERRIDARMQADGGAVGFSLPRAALVRRVDLSDGAAWRYAITAGSSDAPPAAAWSAATASPFLAVRSESAAVAPAGLPQVIVKRRTAAQVELEVDSAGLPAGSLMLLQSSLGWQALKASSARQYVILHLPALPVVPGATRLFAQQALVEQRGIVFEFEKNAQAAEAGRLTLMLLRGGWTSELVDGGPQSELLRLGWLGLVQDPQGGRGGPVEHVVLYHALPAATAGTAVQLLAADWVRQTVALPPPGGAER